MLSLLAALVFHAYYFGWYSWFVLQLTVLLPLLSLLLSLPAMLCARLRLETAQQCMRQDAAYISVQTGGGFLPLPACRFCLRVEHVMSGERKVLRQKCVGKQEWYVRLDTEHVGLLRIEAQKARVYDYLKLFRIPMRTGQEVQIMVKPAAEGPAQLPNLTRFLAKRTRPKPGGGFSEEHEMRPYRPGDMMRDIHWKLSVKTDELIIREAQEPIRTKVLLTLDLVGEPHEIDELLSRLLWLSGWLLEHDTAHQLIWIDPADYRVRTCEISSAEMLEQVMEKLLATRLRSDLPSLSGRRFPGADWRYHLMRQEVAT